jgi:hypothetical protein
MGVLMEPGGGVGTMGLTLLAANGLSLESGTTGCGPSLTGGPEPAVPRFSGNESLRFCVFVMHAC